MTRLVVGLLIWACLAVVLADQVQVDEATCSELAAQVKAEGTKRWIGPKHTFCGTVLETKREAYCYCQVVPRERDLSHSGEFRTQMKAKSFLTGRGIGKRDLNQECCTYGCYWEEIEETCV